MGYHAAIRKEKNLGSKVLPYIYIKIFKVAKNKTWKKKKKNKKNETFYMLIQNDPQAI